MEISSFFVVENYFVLGSFLEMRDYCPRLEKDEIIENIQLIRQTVLDVITFKEGHDKLRSEMKSVVEVI